MQIKLISITPNAEKVIESAGRTAYLSFDKQTDLPIIQGMKGQKSKLFWVEEHPALAPVKTDEKFRVRDEDWRAVRIWKNSAEKFVEMLVRNNHLSVLEHAFATFRISGASRVFTHQLVRHRMASFTQQSQRYIDEKGFRYVEPLSIQKHIAAHQLFVDFVDKAKETYIQLEKMGIRNEDARFVLPNSVQSEIVATADFREWRHIIQIRGSMKAQWEIREAAFKILRIFKKKVPSVFCDLEIDKQKGVLQICKEDVI
ncbi:FAD-dependent thymidylate synthase [bacterium]|nr:FAD-dependent thymidylate synthase [bacterium]RQV93737.1 MAG: FAD-dependent thymidylate synthase [bacterium]